MPTKHLYVTENDATLWEEAEIVALQEHRSVSWVVHEALRRYLREMLDARRAAT